jgi:predicted negative regulator of RcsB-dependent stress response
MACWKLDALAHEVQVRRGADQADALVAQLRQALDGQAHARLVVVVEPRVRLVQLRAAVGDKGHALLRQVGDALVERFRAPDDQAIDAAPLTMRS